MPENTGKILRGRRAMWLSKDGTAHTLLGKRQDDLSIALNPNVEQGQDVTGATYTDHNGFTPNLALPYVCYAEDAIYPHVQKIVDELSMDDTDTTFTMTVATLDIEVKETGEKSASGKGYQVPVKVVPTNDGGSTSGYQIEFTMYEDGARVQGTVSVAKGGAATFSAGGSLG